MCEAGYADIAYVARHMRLPDRAELYAFDKTENPKKSGVTWLSLKGFTGAHLSIGGLYRLSARSRKRQRCGVFHGRMAQSGPKLHSVFPTDHVSSTI